MDIRLTSPQPSVLQSYTYTANGEEQTKTDASGQTTYTYDALGNLRQVTLPDGTLIEYVIDGRNRRIGKKVIINNNTVLARQWLYRDQLHPVAELDASGNLVATFIYGSKSHVPDYMEKDGRTYRVITDHLGSVRLVVGVSDGSIPQLVQYDELGRAAFLAGSEWQAFGFAGGLYDSDTEFVRFGARDYDSNPGRWTAKDPIGFSGRDPNLYEYALSEPVNNFDFEGRDSTLGGALGAVALGAIVADIAINVRLIVTQHDSLVVHIRPQVCFHVVFLCHSFTVLMLR